MKIFDFSEKVGEHISAFQSNFIMSKILKHQGNIHIGSMHLQENGIIGYHEAVVSQLLLIVDGEGYVCGADKEKVKVEAGQAVFWEKGELHETSTEKGLMAIVIESEGLPYKFDTIKEDVLTGKILGVKGGVTGFEDSLSFKNPYVSEISVTQKFIDASVVYGVEDYTFKDDAEVTIQKYEAKLDRIDIPNIIPFFKDHDLEVRAEFGLGTFGYKFHVGQETGAYVGGGKVGGGLFAKFKKRGEEE